MAELRIVATASRKCAAPREAIVAWELEPLNVARMHRRVSVSDVVRDQSGRAQQWTTKLSLARVFQVTFHTVVMAIDPVIVELRNSKQVQVSTVTVSAEPDSRGCFTVDYHLELSAASTWLTRLQRSRYETSTQKGLDRQIDAAIAFIEADARAAGLSQSPNPATGPAA